MTQTLPILCVTAATVGVVHTLLGPDHYLPFVAIGRASRWSLVRTLVVTALCGVGHVLGSVVIGLIGIALGWAVTMVEALETHRGSLAGWALLAFGLVYTVWGVRSALRNRPHTHAHVHADGTAHAHEHTHAGRHAHVHHDSTRPASITPWVLFIIFGFGPCEPLIPLLMYPAAQGSMWGVGIVTVVFGLATITTMCVVVTAALLGAKAVIPPIWTRYGQAAAGAVVTLCGAAVVGGL